MTMKVYTVYDQSAEAYLQPFFAPTKGLALRSFVAAANKSDHDFNRHAADYTLFEIGEWDDSKAEMKTYDVKNNLGCAIEYIQNNPNTDGPRQDRPTLQELKEASQGRPELAKISQEEKTVNA